MAASEVSSVLGAVVRWVPVPDDLPGGEALRAPEGTRLLVRPDVVLYDNGFVRLLVTGTHEVLIQPVGDVPASVVAHHAYGLGARILLLHAGFFSLHASVVETPTGVVAIGGASGAGKSTTSVAIGLRDDCRLLIDDTAPVRADGRVLVVQPFERPVHLYPGTARHLGVADGPVGPAEPAGWWGQADTKVALRVAEPEERPLDRLALLVAADGRDEAPLVDVSSIRGGDRLRTVVRLANSTGLASAAGRRDAFLAWAVQVADALPMIEVRRQTEVDTLDDVIGTLLDPDSWSRRPGLVHPADLA